jgi:hypothetical protein
MGEVNFTREPAPQGNGAREAAAVKRGYKLMCRFEARG